jgi:hypothetical protein
MACTVALGLLKGRLRAGWRGVWTGRPPTMMSNTWRLSKLGAGRSVGEVGGDSVALLAKNILRMRQLSGGPKTVERPAMASGQRWERVTRD